MSVCVCVCVLIYNKYYSLFNTWSRVLFYKYRLTLYLDLKSINETILLEYYYQQKKTNAHFFESKYYLLSVIPYKVFLYHKIETKLTTSI